jgi:PilZ domain
MASQAPEQRRSPRVSLFQEVVCRGDGSRLARSWTAELSEGGLFVDLASPPFEVGERVVVRFAVSPGGAPILSDAQVKYVQDGLGMGLCFVDLSPLDLERIRAYVESVRLRPLKRGEFHLRKSSRVFINVPVRVRAPGPEVDELDESTQIITLSKHGACLLLRSRVDVGAQLLLETPKGRAFKSSVVWVGDGPSRSDGQVGVQCRGLAQSLGFQFP